MFKNDNLAIAVVFVWAFLYESLGTPFTGFYIIPTILSVLVYFYSPLSSRGLNAVLSFFVGFASGSLLNQELLFFSAPFFIILSLTLYVFGKK